MAVSSLVVAVVAMVAWSVAPVIIAVAVIVAALRSAAVIRPPLAPDGGPPGWSSALPMLPLRERGAVVADRDPQKRPGHIGG